MQGELLLPVPSPANRCECCLLILFSQLPSRAIWCFARFLQLDEQGFRKTMNLWFQDLSDVFYVRVLKVFTTFSPAQKNQKIYRFYVLTIDFLKQKYLSKNYSMNRLSRRPWQHQVTKIFAPPCPPPPEKSIGAPISHVNASRQPLKTVLHSTCCKSSIISFLP